MNRKIVAIGLALVFVLTGCASTEYKKFEGKNSVVEGKGGTKVVVEGMEVWDNGDPPRKFSVLGIIDDVRPGGIIPMSQLRRDMVRKAREAGGDALVEIRSESQVAGYQTSGAATAYTYGRSTQAYGSATSMQMRRNSAKFAVIKYLD